jgi:hypothetical protein
LAYVLNTVTGTDCNVGRQGVGTFNRSGGTFNAGTNTMMISNSASGNPR